MANASVNVQDVFKTPLKRKVKTIESIKCGVAIGDKTLYDMASLFCLLITIGPHRQVELQTLLDFELCAVSAAIIGEYGCLRTGTKSSTLVSKLKVDELQSAAPDIVIVDSQQLLYHMFWPCAGSASELANSMKDRFIHYQSTEVVTFNPYDDKSTDHERIRCACEGTVDYDITLHQASSRQSSLHFQVGQQRDDS